MPDDHAILVGISRYLDADHYPPLEGPINDVEQVFQWLRSPGYNLPVLNIQKLVTHTSLMTPEPEVALMGQPSNSQFANAFDTIAYDKERKFRRRDGRLYLYFSGHGFSLQDDRATRAALYGADCFNDYHRNLPGSLYAEAAKRAGLFREIVLIMDCCRDVASEMEYAIPQLPKNEDDDSEGVKVLAIYAAPRRGRAQERELADANGKVVGLATNAWLRALREAQCDLLGKVAASQLKQFILNAWSDWYPEQTPPTPRFVMPEEEDLLFQSGRHLVSQVFRLGKERVPGSRFRIRSEFQYVMGSVDGNGIKWDDQFLTRAYRSEWVGAHLPSRQFELRLPVDEFTLTMEGTTLTFTPGVQHVIEV